MKHKRDWFIRRVGLWVIRNGNNNLFDPPIKIESKQHAAAMYVSQTEKNYKYEQIQH